MGTIMDDRTNRDNGSSDSTTRKPQILSLDDEPEILAVMRRMIQEAGYESWGTSDEAEAMCLLCFSDEIDLFVQDLERPNGIGGCEFLRLMRSHRKLRQIPVLIIS